MSNVSTPDSPQPHTKHNIGLGRASLGAVGGFLFGVFVQVVNSTAATPVGYGGDMPFIFALGGAAIGYFSAP